MPKWYRNLDDTDNQVELEKHRSDTAHPSPTVSLPPHTHSRVRCSLDTDMPSRTTFSGALLTWQNNKHTCHTANIANVYIYIFSLSLFLFLSFSLFFFSVSLSLSLSLSLFLSPTDYLSIYLSIYLSYTHLKKKTVNSKQVIAKFL